MPTTARFDTSGRESKSSTASRTTILLSYDAFNLLGEFELGRDNMFNRLMEVWVSTLGLSVEAVSGLAEIPRNPCYHLHRDDLVGQAVFFHRASYLCKAAIKAFVDGSHGFGASRI